MNDAPQLLVEWPSRWQDFLAAVGPALRPSPPKLKIEARAGLFPLRGIILSLLVEVMVLATAIAHPARLVQDAQTTALSQTHEVIYFSADELPRTEDLGGAAAGVQGTRGGSSQPHASQVIRVARGESLREKVTDAPHLNLPKSDSPISNLLAYKADPLPPAPPVKVARPDVPPAPALDASTPKRPKPELAVAVVPPPPDLSQPHGRSAMTRLADPVVAPPPVSLPPSALTTRSPLASVAVAPPPVSAPRQVNSRQSQLALPAPAVVAPPSEANGAFQSRPMLEGQAPTVVPPPAELGETRHQIQRLGDAAVAPPRPELPQAAPQEKLAHDLGLASVQAPPAASATNIAGGAAGVIVSAKPGSQPAMPSLPEKATLAMSPVGSSSSGAGGQGGGHGISRGNGSGASPTGTASGAASAGAGKSTVEIARNTNSPYPGPGGAGIMASGSPRVPGVSVSGGKNVITLPSFGSTPDPATMARSAAPKNLANGITVVASPRAGGALNLYGALKGDRVYTIYITTRIGTAVMQFADPLSSDHPSANQLIAPRALRAEVPADWTAGLRSKLLIACKLDRDGMIKNAHALQSEDRTSAQQMLSALGNWKFVPAFRGSDAVEVNVILGFGVDTR